MYDFLFYYLLLIITILRNIPKGLYSNTVLLLYMKDIITLRGERDLWIDFTNQLRKEKKQVWDVLKPFISKYIKHKK